MADIGTPPRREPAFNIPPVVVVCCLLLLGIHGMRMALSAETDNGLVALFAFLPARFSYVLHVAPGALAHAYQDTVSRNPILAAQIAEKPAHRGQQLFEQVDRQMFGVAPGALPGIDNLREKIAKTIHMRIIRAVKTGLRKERRPV